MKIRNWHTTGLSAKAKMIDIEFRTVYKNSLEGHPISLLFADRKDLGKPRFLNMKLTKDEATELRNKLDEAINETV